MTARRLTSHSNIPQPLTAAEEKDEFIISQRVNREIALTGTLTGQGHARVDDFLRMLACETEQTLRTHQVSDDTARVLLPVKAWACIAVDAQGVHVHLGPASDTDAGGPSEVVLQALEREIARYRRRTAARGPGR